MILIKSEPLSVECIKFATDYQLVTSVIWVGVIWYDINYYCGKWILLYDTWLVFTYDNMKIISIVEWPLDNW